MCLFGEKMELSVELYRLWSRKPKKDREESKVCEEIYGSNGYCGPSCL